MRSKIKLLTNLLFSETARNTYSVFVGNVTSAFFSFLFTVILVRVLSLSDFGYFSALLSLMLMVTELSDIGIGQSLSSFLPPLENYQDKLKVFLKSAFISQFIITFLVTVFIVLFSEQISQILFHNSDYGFLVSLTGISIFCSVMVNFITYSLSARKKFLKVSFLSASGSLLRLLFLLGIILFTSVTLENSVLMQTLSIILYMIAALILFNPQFLKFRISKNDIKRLFRFAYLLGIARVFTGIAYRLDVLMLVSLKNSTEAGIYSTASRVISIYPMLVGSYLTVIAPKISTMSAINDIKKYTLKIIFGTIGLISTILLLLIFAPPFLLLLFGEKTLPAVPVFRLLLISMIFFVASIPSVALAIFYFKKPYILTINGVIQLIIVIFGNLIFIPVYGKEGAAFSLILAYLITLIITSLMTFRYWQNKSVNK